MYVLSKSIKDIKIFPVKIFYFQNFKEKSVDYMGVFSSCFPVPLLGDCSSDGCDIGMVCESNICKGR